MARTKNHRTRLVRIKEIFERKTDSEHGITVGRIIALLKLYGIDCERKAVYQDIVTLRDELGMDISLPDGSTHEYKLLSREFDVSELKLIIDSILSSKFLSTKESRNLIDKLCSQCSENERKLLIRDVELSELIKNKTDCTQRNVDYIYEAMNNDRQISFLYFDNIYGKQVYRKNGSEYIRSPFKLLCNENNYYLLAYDATAMEIRTYRVDRMAKVQLLDCPRQGWDAYNKIRISEYLKETFNMYGNGHKEKIVTMVFHNCLSNVVIDQFGQDVHMMYEDDEHFRITVKVNVNEQFFGWIFGLGDDVRIIAPQSVIDEMSTMLHKIYDNYDSGI